MLLSHILHAGPTILPHQLDLHVVEVFGFLSQNQICFVVHKVTFEVEVADIK
jgi:hypothetical protein